MNRPTGVTVIAATCFLAAGYIFASSVAVLVWPAAISVIPGTELQRALQFGGPYLALVAGAVWALVGWGLLRLHNWARWAAMLMAAWGIAVALPTVTMRLRWSLFWFGLQVFARLAVVVYLLQVSVLDRFSKSVETSQSDGGSKSIRG